MYDDLRIGSVAGKIGRGLAAGLIGTAAITASQMIELRLRGREPSIGPAEAASKVMGVNDVLEQADDSQKQNLSQMVHWEYGTSWGIARALLDLFGVEGPTALIAEFLAIWATAILVMPKLEGSKPVTEWKPEEVGISAVHHMVYAVAADAAYEVMRHESYEDDPRGFWEVLQH